MQVARKVLFYTFILIFLVLCPLVILYSLGYIFHPQKKEVFQTGSIYLASTPSGAYVYLGGKRYKYRTPTSITGLIPGQYQVSVRLKNYRPWNRQITIEPGKALTFKNILLLPKMFERVNLSPTNTYVYLRPLAGTNYFILQKGSRLKDFYVYNWEKNILKPIIQGKSNRKSFNIDSVFTGNKSNIIIIYGGSFWNKKYFVVEVDKKKCQLIPITNLFLKRPDLIIWNGDDLNNVFAVFGDTVSRLNLHNVSVYPKYFTNVKGFGVFRKHLYILDKNNIISKTTLDKKKKTVLFKDKNLSKYLFKNSRFYTIKSLKNNILLFYGNRGDLIVTIPPYRICNRGVVGISYNGPDNKLLYWTKNSIWIADFKIKNKKNSLFKESVQLRKVYEKGTDISQCFWVYDGAYVLFKDGDQVYLLELNQDVGYHKESIVKVKEKTAIFYTDKIGFLYYIDPRGYLFTLRILPERERIFDSVKDKL